MPDWKTRLAVSYKDEDGNEVNITPIDSFSPSFSLNAEVLHSLEQTHMGVVFSPQSMSFSLTVKAIGDVAAKIGPSRQCGEKYGDQAAPDKDGIAKMGREDAATGDFEAHQYGARSEYE